MNGAATVYCNAQGTYKAINGSNCRWWLRSPGSDSDLVAFVDGDGFVDYSGSHVNDDYGAVRPVLWIDLES